MIIPINQYNISIIHLTSANKPFWLPRCDPVETVTDIVPEIPWWLDCNRDR